MKMTQTGARKQLIRPLAITAAILGIIQGVVWVAISIVSLCCYFDLIDDESSPTTGEYYLYIYDLFLKQDDQILSNTDVIIKPLEISIFMWFYLVLSLTWFVESSWVLWAMLQNKWRYSVILFSSWSAITLVTLIIDLVFIGLIGYDYSVIQNTDDDSIANQRTEILVSYFIVMTVAARGYVLWIVDVIFAIIIFKFTIDIVKFEKSAPDVPIIYGYETESVNTPWQLDLPSTPWPVYPNRAFNDDNNNQMFERSQSFYPAVVPPENYQSNQCCNTEKTATIGRQRSGLNSLNKIPPPMIPDPDYSPPATPLKSVLKSKSNYY